MRFAYPSPTFSVGRGILRPVYVESLRSSISLRITWSGDVVGFERGET